MKIIKDEDNICLKCKNAIIYKDIKIIPKGYSYSFTLCDCFLGYIGKNAGHRKTCKHFEPNEIEEEIK